MDGSLPQTNSLRLVVIGAGYVGLVAGACFAAMGHHVVCVDQDSDRIAGLKAGRIPIFEPGLDVLIARDVSMGRLTFADQIPDLSSTNAVVIAVGTPSSGDGHADLSAVYKVARQIGPHLPVGGAVIVKSTVPVGTGAEIERILLEEQPGCRPLTISNPEFLREGSAINDFLSPDRIVVGCEDGPGRRLMADLYNQMIERGAPTLFTNRATAELIKYASNAFLATKISFINEIADLCGLVDADIRDVSRGMGLDNRIGGGFLQAGPGYGGSCFPKDTRALLATAARHGLELKVLDGAAQANRERPAALAARIAARWGGWAQDKTIAVLGLTFKAQTDDVRESPAIALIEALQERGGAVRAFDPQGMEHARGALRDVEFAPDAMSCVRGADCVVIATEWPQFATLNPRRLSREVRSRLIFDLRGMLDAAELRRAGFEVHGIGAAEAPLVQAPAAPRPSFAPRARSEDPLLGQLH